MFTIGYLYFINNGIGERYWNPTLIKIILLAILPTIKNKVKKISQPTKVKIQIGSLINR